MGGKPHHSYREQNISLEHFSPTRYSQQVDRAAEHPSHGPEAKRRSTQPTYPRVQQQQARFRTSTKIDPRQQNEGPKSAVTDILPYCTTEPPLTQEQVIALSDVAGSMKELVLLVLTAAAGDRSSMERLITATDLTTANNIVDFFVDEWEVEG